MADAELGWAQPGVEVVVVYAVPGTRAYGARHRIAKVYKSGNFVLEGSPQQYRPWKGGRADATGSHGWSRDSLQMVTPEVIEAIKAERRVIAARKIVRAWADHLATLDRSKDAEAIIATAERLGPLQDRDGGVKRG